MDTLRARILRYFSGTSLYGIAVRRKFNIYGSTTAAVVAAPRGIIRFAMSELHRITIDPAQCGGRPCIRGLRIRVSDVLDLLAAGATHDEILADYPYLEAGDITAALQYAARQLDHTVLQSV